MFRRPLSITICVAYGRRAAWKTLFERFFAAQIISLVKAIMPVSHATIVREQNIQQCFIEYWLTSSSEIDITKMCPRIAKSLTCSHKRNPPFHKE
jgi:hypothetical protein